MDEIMEYRSDSIHICSVYNFSVLFHYREKEIDNSAYNEICLLK